MAICGQCILAIQNISSRENAQERERKFNATLPRYEYLSVHECWICRKLSRWLDTNNPEVLEVWRREPIQVGFAVFGSIYAEQPEQGRFLASLSIEILPPCYNKDINGMGCEIGLDFVTPEGIAIISFSNFSIHCGTWG